MFGKRLINTNIPSPEGDPDPSSLTLQSSVLIPGGTYGFSSYALNKVGGGKFFMLKNRGFDAGSVSVVTLNGFDLNSITSVSDSTNFYMGYYAAVIAASPDGSKLASTGYQNSNNNQFISTFSIGNLFTPPYYFSNSASRPFAVSNTLDFNQDGTKIYYMNGTILYERNLSIPFEASSQGPITTINLASISSETMPTYPNNGWYPQGARWSYGGTTFYITMYNLVSSSSVSTSLKAYNASVPFSINSLVQRNPSTNLNIPQINGSNPGMSISQDGHFLLGVQPSNYGNQELYMFA